MITVFSHRYNHASITPNCITGYIISTSDSNAPTDIEKNTSTVKSQLKVATFNLFNYLEPPNAFYDFERIYSAEQWQKKQRWITDYLANHQPDIVGFQEVFSIESLKALTLSQHYPYFATVDEPEIVDDFIYKSPVLAIASRFPLIEVETIVPSSELAATLGLMPDFSFSRKVIRATVELPHIGACDCYVVHFKSKRSMIELPENHQYSPEKTIIESLKSAVAGSWGSTVQRGSEAALLMVDIIEQREKTNRPVILMGDFNNTLSDGILNHLVIDSLRFVSKIDADKYLAQYCLSDAWDLYRSVLTNNNSNKHDSDTQAPEYIELTRPPTHYFGASSSVLDYILLSCEFDASHQNSLYQVDNYHTFDQHLINPLFDRDGESTDHGIVLITLSLRT